MHLSRALHCLERLSSQMFRLRKKLHRDGVHNDQGNMQVEGMLPTAMQQLRKKDEPTDEQRRYVRKGRYLQTNQIKLIKNTGDMYGYNARD